VPLTGESWVKRVYAVINTDSTPRTIWASGPAIGSIVDPGQLFMAFGANPPNLLVRAESQIRRR